MTANKMPEMPEAVGLIFGYRRGSYRPMVSWNRHPGDPQTRIYTEADVIADRRACYLAALEAAKACVPEAREDESHGKYDWGRTDGFNACRNSTLTNLTALEQEAKR